GMCVMPEGVHVRDATGADPEAYLGPEHALKDGSGALRRVKLLGAGERLPVHFYADRLFARNHLGLSHGKTEAWIIVQTDDVNPCVYLGFREDVDAEALAGWVARQESKRVLEALNKLRVSAGDSVFVPAGLPHSIGQGVFLVELQEPSDLSVLLEWAGFAVDGCQSGHLGLGFDLALERVPRTALGVG